MGSYSIRHAGEASIQGSERSGYRFPWYDGCFMPIRRPDCTCTCIFSGGHEAHEDRKANYSTLLRRENLLVVNGRHAMADRRGLCHYATEFFLSLARLDLPSAEIHSTQSPRSMDRCDRSLCQ